MTWSAPYTADPGMVAQLKAVDPSAELLYLANGTWALVARPEGVDLSGRRRTGRSMLHHLWRQACPDPVQVRSAQLIAEGYGVVALHRWEYAPCWSLVRWFEEADHVARTGFEAAYDAREQHSDGRAFERHLTATMEDWRVTEGTRGFRHVMRGLRHFT